LFPSANWRERSEQTPSRRCFRSSDKFVAPSSLKLSSFPDLQSKSSSQFLCLNLVPLPSFVHLIICQNEPISALFPHFHPSSEFSNVQFFRRFSRLPDLLCQSKTLGFFHIISTISLRIVSLALLSNFAQNLMLMRCSSNLSLIFPLGRKHKLVKHCHCFAATTALFASPTHKT
jgi:hypothetical protein